MSNSICCIFNLAPHYNEAIYLLMDKELHCDFYIGDRIQYSLQLMEYEKLSGFKKRLTFRSLIGNFHWQQGAVQQAFKPYGHYIMTGDPHCISTWIILVMNRLSGKKSYLWTHGWYGDERGIKKLIKKAFFSLSHKLLLYGSYAKKLMIEEGFTPGKLTVIYNSLDYENQQKILEKLTDTAVYKDHFKNEYPVLIYIGRLQVVKKLALLIEAVHILKQRDKNFNLMLIGQQTDPSFSELVTSYGLDDQVWYFGPCYDEEILGGLIFNADVCVSPGNVGLTAIHSLVFGTPVITQDNFVSQMPEFEAIIPGETGDFFKEDYVDDLCSKIIQWATKDNNQRNLIRNKCYEVIREKYNPQKQIQVLKSAINPVTG